MSLLNASLGRRGASGPRSLKNKGHTIPKLNKLFWPQANRISSSRLPSASAKCPEGAFPPPQGLWQLKGLGHWFNAGVLAKPFSVNQSFFQREQHYSLKWWLSFYNSKLTLQRPDLMCIKYSPKKHKNILWVGSYCISCFWLPLGLIKESMLSPHPFFLQGFHRGWGWRNGERTQTKGVIVTSKPKILLFTKRNV